MMKHTYYVDISSREISQTPFGNQTSFKINATNDDLRLLRDKFNGMHHGDNLSFGRSHVPILPYHHDKGNDTYDDHLIQAYQLMYELGDKVTRTHIESMGIIPDK
ncbi:MAG TPA: hydrolase [Virgibacillus sp.]|nr:hydrolase [Virgibacillus sp.]